MAIAVKLHLQPISDVIKLTQSKKTGTAGF